MKNKEIMNRYEGLIERLDKAEKWCEGQMYTWDYVKANMPNVFNARENVIKEITYIRNELKLPK